MGYVERSVWTTLPGSSSVDRTYLHTPVSFPLPLPLLGQENAEHLRVVRLWGQGGTDRVCELNLLMRDGPALDARQLARDPTSPYCMSKGFCHVKPELVSD